MSSWWSFIEIDGVDGLRREVRDGGAEERRGGPGHLIGRHRLIPALGFREDVRQSAPAVRNGSCLSSGAPQPLSRQMPQLDADVRGPEENAHPFMSPPPLSRMIIGRVLSSNTFHIPTTFSQPLPRRFSCQSLLTNQQTCQIIFISMHGSSHVCAVRRHVAQVPPWDPKPRPGPHRTPRRGSG